MKRFLRILVLTAGLVISLNVNSFANISFSAWWGGAFGSFEMADHSNFNFDFSSWLNGGIKAHYNLPLGPIGLALGGFCQYTSINVDNDSTPTRIAAGIDAAIFIINLGAIYPYIRGTYSFYDKYAGIGGNGFGVGGGVELAFTSTVKLFVELMYEKTGYTYTDSLKRELELNFSQVAFNLGFTYVIKIW